MNTSIDRFGRLLIPKQMRDHLGLNPGIKIIITEKDCELRIKIAEKTPLFKRKKGVLVFTGNGSDNLDKKAIEDTINKERNRRLDDLASF